jgi:hypothetical protein
MSSSQLLTITESHGFRALIAFAMWIIGKIASSSRGLRNLWPNSQPARMDVGRGSWLRIFLGEVDCSHRLAVLWFDTLGRRDGPGNLRESHWFAPWYRGLHHFPALAPLQQRLPDQNGCRHD